MQQAVTLLREERHFWVEELDGVANEYPYKKILEIFVRVNSGGTKLDASDLMFAAMKEGWSDTEQNVEAIVDVLNDGRLGFDKTFALRCLVVANGKGSELSSDKFTSLEGEKLIVAIQASWARAEAAFQELRDFITNDLKLYADKVVRSYGSFVPLFDYLYHNPKPDEGNRVLMRAYYYKAQLFNWYGAQTDNVINAMHTRVGKPLTTGFPLTSVKEYFRDSRKAETELRLEHLLNMRLRFIILNLIYVERFGASPFNVCFKGNEPHVDHIYPQTPLKKTLGLPTAEINHIGNYRFVGATVPQTPDRSRSAIARISAHARREKSIRHGHISTLHIWWARRPLAACRAVICAALWPDPADPNCPQAFRDAAARQIMAFARRADGDMKLLATSSEEGKARWAALAKSHQRQPDRRDRVSLRCGRPARLHRRLRQLGQLDRPAYLETSRALTQAAHEALGGEPGTRPLVVDPFAGGGSIPLEALRVGADAFASDLNPVAVLLNKVVLEYIPKYGQTSWPTRFASGASGSRSRPRRNWLSSTRKTRTARRRSPTSGQGKAINRTIGWISRCEGDVGRDGGCGIRAFAVETAERGCGRRAATLCCDDPDRYTGKILPIALGARFCGTSGGSRGTGMSKEVASGNDQLSPR
jgi:hypothetical protein